MINGAHIIVYSKDSEADRTFLQDVIGLPSVDVGDGWLIFGLPPSEVAVHPSEEGGSHELFFMCEDIAAFVAAIRAKGLSCTDPDDHGWGVLSKVTLPGGGELGVYEPRHARPAPMGAKPAEGKAAKARAAKAKAKKKAAKVNKRVGKAAKKAGKAAKKAAKKAGNAARKAAKKAGKAAKKVARRVGAAAKKAGKAAKKAGKAAKKAAKRKPKTGATA